MADIYQELVARALATYRLAGNGFHPDSNARAILTALDGLNAPLATLAAAIAQQKAGGYTSPGAYETATRDALRMADAQRQALEAAISAAAAADKTKVTTGPTLDVIPMSQKAKQQQAADAALLASADDVIRHARADAAAAAGTSGGSRRSMTVSERIAREIDEISGQESEEDGP